MGGCSCESLNPERYVALVEDEDNNNDKSKIRRILNHSKYKFTPVNVGRGLTSVVAIAVDRQGKKYAVKQIKKYSKEYHPDWAKNEAAISVMMNHPNIIKTYEIFEDDSSVNFIMDLCEKGDLVQYINYKHGKLSSSVIINIFIQVLETIDYMHNTLHVCHRDIKLENYLISNDNGKFPQIKLIDFGFATRFSKGKKMTEQLGTLEFMAPELLSNNGYDEKVDIWASGVLLYVLATAKIPFNKNSNTPIDEQIFRKNIEFDLIKNFYLRGLCQKLLDRNPERRPDAKEALNLARNVKDMIGNDITN